MYVNHTNLALKTPFMLLEFRYMMMMLGCNHDTEARLENLLNIDIHIFSSVSVQKLKCPSSAWSFLAQLGKF